MKSQSRLNQTVGVPATASSQLGSGALLFNRRALKSLHIHIHSHIIKTYFKNRESFHQKPQMAGDLAEDFKLHTEYARQMGSWRSSIHNEVQKCDNDFGPLGFHSHGLKAGARNMWKQMEIRWCDVVPDHLSFMHFISSVPITVYSWWRKLLMG